jgi:hypothetical protein
MSVNDYKLPQTIIHRKMETQLLTPQMIPNKTGFHQN